MVTLRPNATVKSLGFSIACAVMLCGIHPLLVAQIGDGLVSGIAQKVSRPAAPSVEFAGRE